MFDNEYLGITIKMIITYIIWTQNSERIVKRICLKNQKYSAKSINENNKIAKSVLEIWGDLLSLTFRKIR